ncbi:LEAF RUST 10 DISEASE-RESISTANCE LOCUS RECEPTOR-LIKE PROTEIN KINASE-like [Olea europaea subsp. europaea]|uniref:LEAF RUST 10 DISEASE-RESISTANCE LOCUS RECEPTOR-LIKE PROTEIN KINASE-like n=1 Tax=Olea europaea subsp. europaea TaxID=158383 RepID=A0A8S0PGR2_OLEEU|nr:LEAF RUST 10 DISEASE-RESISTANCE LOCUS RECEPTOR-LIKE PROTEIN KINASE-like [Olea europaea subsp. europaea]
MAFSRELYRPASSFPVYFSLFYLLNLNFVYSKCPESFKCGNLGRLEFPFSNSSQPECGLFRVQCDATPHPLVYLEYEGISSTREILSKISAHVFRIRNPTLEGELKNESDSIDLFDQLSVEYNLQWFLSVDCAECHNKGGQCTNTRKNEFICEKAAGRSKLKLIFFAGVPAVVVVLFSIILFIFNRRKFVLNLKRKTQNHKDIELFLKNNENLAPRRYNYFDIKKMTKSFSDSLGEGGFARVYGGKLSDGRLVAVKILKESKDNGEEFINEVASISKTSHINIVTLLGFCFEGSKRALIYEFMPNGSLEKFICNNSFIAECHLGWEKLFQIAVSVAQGIEYLHQGCNTRILHFDVKPHNILLDKDFNPKISDFCLARLCPNRSSKVSMLGARGTIGYIAPEIVSRNFGDISQKSDVYSYGMMILEMAGETKNIGVRVDHSSENYFPDWIYKNLEQNAKLDLNNIVNANEHLKRRKMLIVGLWCIQTDPRTRPSMSRVVEMLEGNMESLQMPPKPNFFIQPREAVNPSTFELSLSFSDIHEVKQ